MRETTFFHPSWPVLYEDNHLLALYKPAGLLVQGDRSRDIALIDLGKLWLKQRYAKPGQVYLGMVHRLDRPVAGVVLFCKTSKAAARISEQFRSGRVRKEYVTVVEGVLRNPSGHLTHWIERGENRSSRILPGPSPQGQEARLSFRLLDATPSRSLVEIQLETGRKHQIRLQMAHIGHPVLGDLRYGASAPLPHMQLALFARRLSIEHPTRRDELVIESPLPRGWPWPGADSESPPWDWRELEEAVCAADDPSSPCSRL